MALHEKGVEPTDARLGRVLRGKYRLDRVLGIGGMATVYAATHRNSKQFAIKVLHAELSSHESVRGRFLREGYLANQVKHPGAVVVLDDDVAEDGSAFVVMELLEGSSLDEVWRENQRKLPLPMVLSIGDAILDVLIAAHARGIVHRDLKPANIFLTNDGALKVLDFGIASLREEGRGEVTLPGAMIGTPAFMAPEQALARIEEVDGRTDLWAVGATLFALIAGRLVHDGDNAPQLLVNAATRPAPPLADVISGVPASVAGVIDRALAFQKRDRWPGAVGMREALVAACLDATRAGIAPLAPRAEVGRGAGPDAHPSGGDAPGKSGGTAFAATMEASVERRIATQASLVQDPAESADRHPPERAVQRAPARLASEELVHAPKKSRSGAIEPVTALRSTLIAASVLTLQSKGYFDAYLKNLPGPFHAPVLQSVPGAWVPFDVAVAHYRAANALDLTSAQQFDLGRGVAERVQKGFLGTLVRMARGSGVTPWLGLDNLAKLWERTFRGGATTVYRLGPKEARIECYGIPDLAELPYFRQGFAGMFSSSAELFCSKIYVHILPAFTLRKVIGFRLAWA